MSRHHHRCLAAFNLLVVLLLALPLPAGAAPSLSAAPRSQEASVALAAQPPAASPLPVDVQVALGAPILHPDEETELTVTVTNESPEPLAELWLSLDLPPKLDVTPRIRARLPLPTLAGGASHTAAFRLALHRARAPAKDTVQAVAATVGARGYDVRSESALLGVTGKAPGKPGRPEPSQPRATVMDDQGAILEDDAGDLALIAAVAAVTPTTVFTYTPLYRWDQPGAARSDAFPPAEPLSGSLEATATAVPTAQAALPYRVLLPAVAGGDSPERTSASPSEPGWPALRARARQEDGIYFVHQWQLDAAIGDQTIHGFTEPLAITLQLDRLRAAGVDPTLLTLWTRPGPGARWRSVPTRYDPAQATLTAWLPHFSQFGLGAGLVASGDLLPNVKAFTVDQLNGGATVQIPIAAPKGLGGLAPNVGFNYASVTLDDLRRVAGDHEMLAQASSVGIGWHLDGVSYIARTDDRFDDDTPDTEKEFALVLNGMRVGIQHQNGRWHTNPELFARITWDSSRSGDAHDFGGWTVTLPDGVRYQFGAGGNFGSSFDPASATATALERTYGGNTFRLAKRWYLRKVTDPLGNSMELRYRGEKEWESGCVADSWVERQKHWYTRTIDPTEILWSGNPGQGVSHKLRMLFTYIGGREDYQVRGRRTNDCIQAMFGFDNQLSSVQVQAWDPAANGWYTLRSYVLLQDFKRFVQTDQESKLRMYLAGLEVHGRNGGLLQRYGFTYDLWNTNLVFLRRADNGLGGATNYLYTGHRVSCSNSTCPYTKTRHAVTRVTAEDGLGHSAQTAYSYGPADAPGSEWGAVANDGGFLGFRTVEITSFDLDSPGTVLRWERMESFDSGAEAARGNPDPRRGKVRRREVRPSASATALAVYTYDWRAYWLENGAWSSTATDLTYKETDDAVSAPVTWLRLEKTSQTVGAAANEERFTYEGSYGNRVTQSDYADGSLLRTTVTDYAPNPTAYIVDRPARTRIFAGSVEGGVCSLEIRTFYDTNGADYLTPPPLGLVTQLQQAVSACSDAPAVALDDSNWITTRYSYDDGAPRVGNRTRTEVLGAAGAQETAYDTVYFLFPIRQTVGAYSEYATYYGVNGLPMSDSKAFWGAMQEHCGVDGLCTRQAYDEFGRPLRQWTKTPNAAPWGSDATAAVLWSYRSPGMDGARTNIVSEWRAPRCYGNFIRRHYNGFGQLVQEQRPDDDWRADVDGCTPGANSPEIDVHFAFDGLGRQSRVTVPQNATGNWYNRILDWSSPPPNTATLYDALDRPLRSTAPNGAITDYKYVDRKTAVIGRGRDGDPDKVIQWREVDGLGNLRLLRTYSKPFDQGGVVEGELQLSYDVLGNLRQVSHPLGIGQTNFTYDLAGRKTGLTDPDLGTWSYAYDKRGQLTRQTDARGKTICLGYDPLGRITGKDYRSDATCPTTLAADVIFAYDQNASPANRAWGQLTEVRMADGSYRKTLVYNDHSLLAAATVIIAGAPKAYTERYAYDPHDRLQATIYPDGEAIKEYPNSRGLPKLLCPATLRADGQYWCTGEPKLVDGALYNADGQLTTVTYPAGGGMQRTQRYFPWAGTGSNGNGLLAGIDLNRSGAAVLSLGYAYDSFANLRQITHNGVAAAFTYDAQNRLISGYGRTYTYDGAGRITQYEGVSLAPVAGHLHAATPAGAGYTFDANGNVTARNGQLLGWDHENRLTGVMSAGLTEGYRYDPDGQRIRKVTNGATTYYPFPGYEVTNNGVIKHYFFGGQRIAQRRDGILTYFHGDHLGSAVLATDLQGRSVGEEHYYAYGRDRSGAAVPTDRRFTGQRSDATGLIYFNARYYDPTLGQFLSPDPLVPDPNVLPDHNRYLYTRGNPLKYTDPSGHVAICFQGGASPVVDTEGSSLQLCDAALAQGGYDPEVHGAIYHFAAAGSDLVDAYRVAVAAAAEGEPILLVGYSWGGAAALSLAQQLNDGIVTAQTLDLQTGQWIVQRANANTAVDLLVLVDVEESGRWLAQPYTGIAPPPNQIPPNVDAAFNLAAGRAEGSEWWIANGRNEIAGAANMVVDLATHYTIVNISDPRNWTGIARGSGDVELNTVTLEKVRGFVYSVLHPGQGQRPVAAQ